MKKKILLSLVAVLAISAMVVALVACDPDNKNDDTAKVGSNAYTIGYSAASAAAMMNAQQSATASAAAQNGNSFGFTHRGEITAESSEMLQEIAQQIKAIEEFIDRSSVQIKEEVSDRTDFTHKMVITANSALTGENDTYTLYYNTKLVASETETDDDTLDIETEEEYTLQGILVNGEEEFTVSGEMEIESEGDENGQEFSMVASDSFGNQIRFSQEFSTEGNEIEEELNYEFWVLGVKVYAFSVEFETDEDGEELVPPASKTSTPCSAPRSVTREPSTSKAENASTSKSARISPASNSRRRSKSTTSSAKIAISPSDTRSRATPTGTNSTPSSSVNRTQTKTLNYP